MKIHKIDHLMISLERKEINSEKDMKRLRDIIANISYNKQYINNELIFFDSLVLIAQNLFVDFEKDFVIAKDTFVKTDVSQFQIQTKTVIEKIITFNSFQMLY